MNDMGGGGGGDGGGGDPPRSCSGFAATEAARAVPDPIFDALAGNIRVDPASWATIDLDGDRKPDLVHLDRDQIMQRRWILYANTGTGFSASASAWPIPKTLFDELAGTRQVDPETWATTDLDGDGCLDLVQTTGTMGRWSIWAGR